MLFLIFADPFDEVDRYFPQGVNLHVFEEGRKETVGGVKEFWNRDKIMQSYGQFVMDYLQDKPILCSGEERAGCAVFVCNGQCIRSRSGCISPRQRLVKRQHSQA